jgi:tetratricopeptide (TPR) repeat protein
MPHPPAPPMPPSGRRTGRRIPEKAPRKPEHPRRRSGHLGLPVLACLGLLLGATPAGAQPGQARRPPAAAQDAEQRRKAELAKQLHDEARELYDAGEYRKAIGRLERALELDPEGKELVYNLGLIHEKLGEVDRAELYYQQYLEMETDAVLRERTQRALKRIEGVKKELATQRSVAAAPSTASAAVQPAAPVRTTRPIGPWVWITGGVAVSALIVGNVFAISAISKSPGDDARTGDGVGVDDLQADADAAHSRAVVADVSFVVALLAGGAAAYLYLSTPPRPVRAPDAARPDTRRLDVAAAAGRGAVRVRF